MSSIALKQKINSVISQVKDGIYGDALTDLIEFHDTIKYSYFVYNSSDFKPDLIEKMFMGFLPLLDFQTKMFKKALDQYLRQWFSLCISYCPQFLLQLIQKIRQQIPKPIIDPYLLEALSNLLLTLPVQVQVEQIPLLQKLLFACPPQCLSSIDDRIWTLLINNLKEDDIIDLALFSVTSEDSRPAIQLSQKNPEQIVSILVLNAPYNFLYTFLKGVNCKFDMVPLLAKISDTLTFEESVSILRYVLKTFIILLDLMDESQADACHPIISNLLTRMNKKKNPEDKEDQTVLKPYVLKALIKSEKQNLAKFDQFKEYFDLQNETLQDSILHYYLAHIDEDSELGTESKNKIYDLLLSITAKRSPKPLAKLIKAMIHHSESLKKVDSLKYDQIYERIYNPLPKTEKCLTWAIRLLNFSKDYDRFNRHIYDLISPSSTEEFSEKYYIELRDQIELFNTSVNFDRIDWFCGRSHLYLLLFKSIKAQFVLELLAYNLVEPEHLDVAIDCLCHEPTVSGPLAFTTVLSLLNSIADQMGYGPQLNFEKLHLNLNLGMNNTQNSTELVTWLSRDDISKLYKDIRQSIPKSSFGRILSSLVRCLTHLKSFVTITDSLAVALIMIVRCLANSAPEESPALIAEVYKDMKEGKIEVLSDKLKTLLEDQVQAFFLKDQISMYGKASSEFLRAKIQCLGEEVALTKNTHEGLLVDAASKDAEIASKYQSRIQQPLPHLSTFLYFTEDSHKDWRKECQETIPFNFWNISQNKVEITEEMIPEKTNCSLLDHCHFNLYCETKKIEKDKIANKEYIRCKKVALYRSSISDNNEEGQLGSHFLFSMNDLHIIEGPLIHPNEPATLYGVICYLWHSKYPLPESVKVEEIEEFCLSNADKDIRIAVGYLAFAQTHNLPVNINEWLKKIIVNERDDLSIFAASLLLCFPMEKVDKKQIKEFVDKSLESLGYYNQTDASIIDLFENETGMKWQFIRSIVRLYFLSTNNQARERKPKETQEKAKTETEEKPAETTENENNQTEEKQAETTENENEKTEEKQAETTEKENENETTVTENEKVENTAENENDKAESNENVNPKDKEGLASSSANLLEVEAALQVDQTVTNSLKISNLFAMSEFATISDTQNVIAAALQQLTMNVCTATFAHCARAMSTLFLFNREDMTCHLLLPTNYNVNQRLMSFIDNTMYQRPLVIGSGVIDSIISVLNKISDSNEYSLIIIPSCFVILLLNLATTEAEYSHIIDLITKRVGKTQDFSRRILLHADEYIDADEKMAEFLNFKPPSFIRGLFRSVIKKRKANIPSEKKYLLIIKNLFNKLITKENFIFPDLCYAGMAKIGMEPWKTSASNLTKLRLGFNDLQTIMGAHTEIGPQNGESYLLYKPISQLEDKDFRETHAWPDAASAKKDFVRLLLEAAVDETASTVFTNNVFSVVSKNTSLKDLAEIVLDQKYMNNGKFSAVTLVFRKLEALLVKAEMEDLVHECVAYHNPNKKMFDDDERINAFYNPNDEKSIAISLKYQRKEKVETPATNEEQQKE